MKKNLFNSVKIDIPNSNTFDLSHDVKQTMKMGELVPTLVLECIPSDKIQLSNETLIRFAPLLAPVMHRMDAYIHYFFVPNRILWPNWEKFIVNPSSDIVPPVVYNGNYLDENQKRFMDYMGVPPMGVGEDLIYEINALPFAAYNKIYDEYYRGQYTDPELKFTPLTDGNNPNLSKVCLLRSWEHDYFTSALPFAQAGQVVDIPLGELSGFSAVKTTSPQAVALETSDGQYRQNVLSQVEPTLPQDSLFTDLEGITVDPTTINDLRKAFKLQEFLEKLARGGSRYIEVIKSFWGITSSDARLQRPEYITGSKSPIVVSEVLNTTGLTDASGIGLPQGNMSGHAISVNGSAKGYYEVEEHGYIIGIMSIIPKPNYQQGIPKTYMKKNPTDYYWPPFANIGEQPILAEELYAKDQTKWGQVFGYIPKYAEYKFMLNRTAGDFRTTLDYWTLTRKFAQMPVLNEEFTQVHPDNTERIFAVQDGTDPIYCQILHKIIARRKMPIYGTPTF